VGEHAPVRSLVPGIISSAALRAAVTRLKKAADSSSSAESASTIRVCFSLNVAHCAMSTTASEMVSVPESRAWKHSSHLFRQRRSVQ
jgi:DNA-binding transcriptional regulator PaaX